MMEEVWILHEKDLFLSFVVVKLGYVNSDR